MATTRGRRSAAVLATIGLLTATVFAAGAVGFAWWYGKPIDTGPLQDEDPFLWPRHLFASLLAGAAATVAALAVLSPVVAVLTARTSRPGAAVVPDDRDRLGAGLLPG